MIEDNSWVPLSTREALGERIVEAARDLGKAHSRDESEESEPMVSFVDPSIEMHNYNNE